MIYTENHELQTQSQTMEGYLTQESVEVLVERVKRRESEALGILYDRYSGRVYAFLARAVERELAEELLQDVFFALWRKAHLYNPSLGSFTAWFFTLVRHRLYDALPGYQRRRNRTVHSRPGAVNDLLEIPVDKFDFEEYILHRFRDEEVRRALASLPYDQRLTILMTYFGGYSHKELAEQLNVPLTTIKGRSRVGLQRLRKALMEP